MNPDENISELHERLDDLERRLADTLAKVGKAGPVPVHYQARIDEIKAQADAMRHKLQGADQSTWAAVKNDLEADWQVLKHAFERWAEYVDERYQRRDF